MGSFPLLDCQIHSSSEVHSSGWPCSQLRPPPDPRMKRELPNPTSTFVTRVVLAEPRLLASCWMPLEASLRRLVLRGVSAPTKVTFSASGLGASLRVRDSPFSALGEDCLVAAPAGDLGVAVGFGAVRALAAVPLSATGFMRAFVIEEGRVKGGFVSFRQNGPEGHMESPKRRVADTGRRAGPGNFRRRPAARGGSEL
jgi:hypothetical protein